MAQPVTNFGLVTVSIGYGAADVSIALQAGDGAKLPATTGGYTYPMTWWNATDYAHPADDPNVEIVTVTSRSTDTLTVTRAQEGTSASTKNAASKTYRMSLGITKAMLEALRTNKSTFHGLQLRTAQSYNNESSQVEIMGVEAIVMDDGTELRNDNGEWTGKTAEMSISGAGGLDTGAEASSTWYEIYAIAKEDATRNLLFHQSKLWAINTNYPTNDDADQPLRSATTNERIGQGFKVGDSGRIIYVNVKLKKVGAPTGGITFRVETDAAGLPSGTFAAVSEQYDVSRLPTTETWVRFTMTTTSTLSATPTQYHLTAVGSYAVNASNYVAWRMDGSAGSYANGSKSLYNSGTTTWTADADDDMIFEIGLETDVSLVTMPTGYTKKCFLGWVYNDGSSNFVPFTQLNRSRRNVKISNICLVDQTNGTAQLIDFLVHLPPRESIAALVCFTGTGTSAGLLAIGDLQATDISSVGDTTGAQMVIYAGTTTTRPTEFREVFIESLGAMAMGTNGGDIWVTGFSW